MFELTLSWGLIISATGACTYDERDDINSFCTTHIFLFLVNYLALALLFLQNIHLTSSSCPPFRRTRKDGGAVAFVPQLVVGHRRGRSGSGSSVSSSSIK